MVVDCTGLGCLDETNRLCSAGHHYRLATCQRCVHLVAPLAAHLRNGEV